LVRLSPFSRYALHVGSLCNAASVSGFAGQPQRGRPAAERTRKFPRSADCRQALRFRKMSLEVFLSRQEALQISNRIFAESHLAQVIFPYIGLDCPPREWLSVDGDHFALSVHPGVGGRGYDEIHLRALFPKGTSEIMRENQGIKAAVGGKKRNRFIGTWPISGEVCHKPTAKFEAVGIGLIEQHEQSLFTCHSTFPVFATRSSVRLSEQFPQLARTRQMRELRLKKINRSLPCINVKPRPVSFWNSRKLQRSPRLHQIDHPGDARIENWVSRFN